MLPKDSCDGDPFFLPHYLLNQNETVLLGFQNCIFTLWKLTLMAALLEIIDMLHR